MATEAGFPGNPFQETESVKRRTSNVNKRKRESVDVGLSGNRIAPNTRRTSSQFIAPTPAQQSDTSQEGADESAIVDLGNESFQHSAANGGSGDDANAQFDFALQPSSTGSQIGQATATGESAIEGVNVDTAAAALTQHYSMTVPRHPAETFAEDTAIEPESSVNLDSDAALFDTPTGSLSVSRSYEQRSRHAKAPVGSEEWHKVRKDNHKEVERRRRETINEGITELSKIVPGCEKNKGSILQRAVDYIGKLHDEASQNIDKWTFEKLVTEQAINELSAKLQRAWAEKEAWKRVAREAGVDVDAVDLGLAGAAEAGGSAPAADMTTGASAGAGAVTATATTAGEQVATTESSSADEDGVQVKASGDDAA